VNERTTSGPNIGLLLLIPAAAIIARAAIRHHHLAWDEAGGPGTPAPYGRPGHRFGGPGRGTAGPDGLRLPPRIEWMLDTWHTRAHQATDAAGTTEAPAASGTTESTGTKTPADA
jgi:hypothetical protein